MKKLLSLLLTLVLCLGMFVACDNEDETLEIDTSKNAAVQYYYHETVFDEVDSPFENEVVLVESYKDFIDFAEERTIYSYKMGTSIREQYFEDHYLLRIKRGDYREIGYRMFRVDDDGKASIILDKLSYYDLRSYYNGKVIYGVAANPDGSAQEAYRAYYDFVLIPKSEISAEINSDTAIELYTLTYCVQD